MADPRHTHGRATHSFTLIELLVVVAIIAILAAILLPVLGRAKYQAKLVEDGGRLRQLGQALMMYANDHDDFYPRTLGQSPWRPVLRRDGTRPRPAQHRRIHRLGMAPPRPLAHYRHRHG